MEGGGGAGSDEGESLAEGGWLKGDHLEGEGGQEGDKLKGGGQKGRQEGDRKIEEQRKGKNNQPKGCLETGESRTSKSDTNDPFVGQPKLFLDKYLPSQKDVFNHFRAINMSSEQRESGMYRKTNKEAMRDTAESVEYVWSKGPFPHISKAGIIKKIEKIHNTN